MLLVAAVICLACVACSDDDNAKEFVPGAGPILTGTTTVTPTVEGTWVLTSTPAAGSCGALNVLYPTESVLTLVQAGNDLAFTVKDSCGRSIPGGRGRVEVAGTIELGSNSIRSLTPTCALKFTQALIGLVEKPPNVFTGSDVLTIDGSNVSGFDQCDVSLPCTVSGSFTATRCPREGCAVTCAP
jgi:hypothetical protein